MSVFSRLFKARDKPKNSLFGNAYSFFFSGTCSGKAVNERTAMQTTMAKPKWMLTIDDVIIYGI